jgi:Mrp family chromosome partitioning ATPase
MNETDAVSLRHALRVLRRRKWTILQAVVIVTASAVAVALRSPTEYRATATVLVGPADSVGVASSTSGIAPETAAKLVRTRAVAEQVREALASERSVGDLLGRVETAEQAGDFVTVTARAPEPDEAREVANAFAEQFVAARERAADDRIARAIDALEDEMALLAPASPERQTLAAEVSRLRLRAALPTADVSVVEPAVRPAAAAGPKGVREGLLGLGLGLVLGLGLAFVRELLDPSVKSADELAQLVPAPQLGSVPAAVFKRSRFRLGRRRPPIVRSVKRHPEPFEALRASLLFFNADREIRSIVVTSPGEREGKTTVTSNLAVAVAKLGLRVCLVDADLRRPRVAHQLGLDGAAPGLTDLVDGAALSDVIQPFPLPDARGANGNGFGPEESRHISVVTSGRTTARPAELLEGGRMAEVLDSLASEFDLVIVDSSPVLRVSDPIPLIARASGALLVVRLFETPRESVTRALGIIDRVGGNLLGVVGTGLSAADLRREGAGPYLAKPSERSRVA